MDNFCVPKTINRHVMQALAALQGQSSGSMFVLADAIIQQVQLQMRRNRKMINTEFFVRKSLSSLTHLGILVRSGTSEYALRQNLEFDQGVSAIPWKKTESAAKNVKPKHTAKKPKSMTTKPRSTKNRIIKTKVRDIATKASQDKKRKGLMCMECHPAYSAFLTTVKDFKNDRPVKNIPISVTHMDVELMDGSADRYSGSNPANCNIFIRQF